MIILPRAAAAPLLLLAVALLVPAESHAQAPRGRRGGDAEALRNRLAPVLKLTDEQLVKLIPDRSGLHFVGCPNCNGGAQERQLTWSLERPDEVSCQHCKMRFPNEKFPENQVVRVKNALGVEQDYPCWESPDPPPQRRRGPREEAKEGYRYFFRAKGWFLAREYFSHAAADLANLHRLTGDRTAARRAAQILDRFAQVYPGYCAHFDLPFTQKRIFPGDVTHPFPVEAYRAAKWSWWAYMDIPEELIRAYDNVRDSGEIDAAMKHRIEDDFFRASVAFVRGYKPLYGNMDPTLIRGLIAAGRVLNEPEYIHDSVDRIGKIVGGQFFADGMWREGSTSYHRQTVGGVSQLADLLKGYSDPPGYRHPGDGARFDNLDLAARLPILAKAREIPALMRYPDGRTVAVHDAWASERGGPPTDETGPLLFPAFGHARLGRGKGDDQLHAHLHFSGGYGHQHADLLGVTLFARGQERLADLGYTHTRYRIWSVSTLSHNTVMVDGRDQETGALIHPNDGSLTLYEPGDDAFQVVEASAPRAYPNRTRDYRRMLILVGVAPETSYVVDLFRVDGGKRHEYILVGDADHDGALKTDLPLTRFGATMLPDGVKIKLPTGESVAGDAEGNYLGYAFIRDVDSARPSGKYAAVFTSESTPKGAVKVHRLPEPGAQAFVGQTPSLRRAHADDSLLDRYTAPVLVERREGSDLSSTFASVLEPYAEKPFLGAVERLPLDDGKPGDVALRIDWDGGADYLLVSGNSNGSTVRVGDLELNGRLGMVRVRGGSVESMRLVGGSLLRKGDRSLKGSGTLTDEVAGVLRKAKGDDVDGLILAGPPPSADLVKGRTAIVTDPAGFSQGHRIADVSHRDGRTVLVLADDPAFEVDAEGRSRQVFFPGRSWTGVNRVAISTMAASNGR